MNKYKYNKLIICLIMATLVLSLIGCNDKGKITTKAIYLAPKSGGQLTKEDIDKYPEVVSVTSFNELKKLVSKNTAIWIDKDSVDLVKADWIQKESESKIPIALIGYNNALYSFREKFSLFRIKDPYVDWSKQKLEPGFSIAMLKEETNTSISSFIKGYDITPDTKQILSKTNMLLEGKFPK